MAKVDDAWLQGWDDYRANCGKCPYDDEQCRKHWFAGYVASAYDPPLPRDDEAERTVLGSLILLYPSESLRIEIDETWFHLGSLSFHGWLFGIVREAHRNGLDVMEHVMALKPQAYDSGESNLALALVNLLDANVWHLSIALERLRAARTRREAMVSAYRILAEQRIAWEAERGR